MPPTDLPQTDLPPKGMPPKSKTLEELLKSSYMVEYKYFSPEYVRMFQNPELTTLYHLVEFFYKEIQEEELRKEELKKKKFREEELKKEALEQELSQNEPPKNEPSKKGAARPGKSQPTTKEGTANKGGDVIEYRDPYRGMSMEHIDLLRHTMRTIFRISNAMDTASRPVQELRGQVYRQKAWLESLDRYKSLCQHRRKDTDPMDLCLEKANMYSRTLDDAKRLHGVDPSYFRLKDLQTTVFYWELIQISYEHFPEFLQKRTNAAENSEDQVEEQKVMKEHCARKLEDARSWLPSVQPDPAKSSASQ